MTYFLILYNRLTGDVHVTEFDETRRHEALSRRFALENDFKGLPEWEVVVLGGTDLEQIKRTHGRYFKDASELAAS